MQKKRLQRIAFAGVAALLVVALLELASWAIVSAAPAEFGRKDLTQLAYTPAEIKRCKNLFHPLLGWNKPFRTQWGERPRPVEHGAVLLSSFGDSFTFCDEVEDDETWQVHLSRQLGADVLNFGVNAYGTDQAYLRFKLIYPRVKTPVVVLGFLLENLNRCRNVFRRFYILPPSSIPFPPKPRFRLDEAGELTLIRTPVRRVNDLQSMMDPEFLETLGANDDYYDSDDYGPGFPHLRLVGQKIASLLGGGESDTDRSWSDPAHRALIFALLDAFVTEATKLGGRPVLFLEPEQEQITAPPTDAEAAVVEYCRSRRYHLFNGIRELAAVVGPEQVDGLFARRGHASAAGNVLIAERMHEYLRAHDLVPPRD